MLYMGNQVGSAEMRVNALLYGPTTEAMSAYMRNQFNHALPAMDHVAQAHYERARSLYTEANRQEVVDFMAQYANQHHHVAVTPVQYVARLTELAEFQDASPYMQRWIMADTAIRQQAMDGQRYGYFETYYDMEPGLVGQEHYDWRQVNDGMVHVPAEGPATWSFYPDELLGSDEKLSPAQQHAILDTQENARMLMALLDQDPTDPVGNVL